MATTFQLKLMFIHEKNIQSVFLDHDITGHLDFVFFLFWCATHISIICCDVDLFHLKSSMSVSDETKIEWNIYLMMVLVEKMHGKVKVGRV